MTLFHLAFPVDDLDKARQFYSGLLGCNEGRSAPRWVDFDFHGHQISAHLRPDELSEISTNEVDGDKVPVRHFGLILPWDAWERLAAELESAGQDFVIAPRVRFQGEPGEQGTFFIRDPAGNVLEFKTFRAPGQVFER